MIAALRSLGHEVLVVAPSEHGAAGMGSDLRWVAKLRTLIPRWLYELAELAQSFVAYHRLARAARKFRPDMIYERYNLFLLAGLMAKRRFKVPLLLEVNSPLVQERERFGQVALPRLANWAEKKAWQGADQVLPVTRVLARYVIDRGVAEDRVTVISNGVNVGHFATAPRPEVAKEALGLGGMQVLGFTGFVREWHGIDRVLQWMAETSRSIPLHLLIVGDGPARPDLERLATTLGVADVSPSPESSSVPVCRDMSRHSISPFNRRCLIRIPVEALRVSGARQGDRRTRHDNSRKCSRTAITRCFSTKTIRTASVAPSFAFSTMMPSGGTRQSRRANHCRARS
jgi:glycosyltransferase involved in cell wall biosynthesis